MRVSFDVHGKDAAELESLTMQRLREFGERQWHWTISAEPEMSGVNGEVMVWRGEVTAHD